MVAYLFAGQGSQYVGMGKDLCDSFPAARSVFERADKVLGFSISGLCFNGKPEMLKQTVISQPAILTVTIAALEAFKHKSAIKPEFMAGLSLGEYSALIAAGAFKFEDGLRLVRKRAEIMDEAARRNPGKMAAVLDLPFEKVKEICFRSQAEIANLNAPGQVVITGRAEAVDKAKELCEAEGAKRVIELDVSGAFHSSLMFEASGELREWIRKTPLSNLETAVISNYTALPQYRAAQVEENLVFQVYSCVKWEASVRYMLAQGVTDFYEFGPGKVLKGLMRRIDPAARVVSIEKKADIEEIFSS